MPIFEATCAKCDETVEFYVPKFTEKNPKCKKCGGKTEREYSVPKFHDFFQLTKTTAVNGYSSPHIGFGPPAEIRTHKQLADECKKHGVVPAWGKESRLG